MKQSSVAPTVLPAWLAFVALAAASVAPAAAQERYRTTREENFRADPEPRAALLATVGRGITLAGGGARGGWVEVTLEGWIWERSLGPSDRDGYDRRVATSGGENLRAEPNGPVLARVRTGTLFHEVARRDGWVHVRRTGWMWRQSLERTDAPPPPVATPRGGTAAPATLDRVTTTGAASLLQTPDGDTVGVVAARVPARVLARSGEWVRVQFEGWVRDTDLRPAEGGVLLGVTSAEVRGNPDAFEGQLLQWTLQYISLQTADELRREMPEGTPYMLARGPLPEAGFVYLTLNPEQLQRVRELPPLAELTVIGRVRTARSRYVGNPVLDLVDFAVVTERRR